MLKRLALILALAGALVACQNTPAGTSNPTISSPALSSPSSDLNASPSDDMNASPSGDDESEEPSGS